MTDNRKSLYIETTIPSYHEARDSTDVLKLHRQIVTRAFWADERQKFRLYTSDTVHSECRQGDPEAAARRIAFLRGIEALPVTDEDLDLAADYRRFLGLPDRAANDGTHLAICVNHRIDYLLTWNCNHLGPIDWGKTGSQWGIWTLDSGDGDAGEYYGSY